MQFNYFFSQFEGGGITSLKSVTIDDNYDRSIKYCLPPSVTHLIFGKFFNQPIERKQIPLSSVDQQIESDIPASITHLTFGDSFDKPIKCCIPQSVTHLKFGKCFNQSIKDCIPTSVTHLEFGICFDQSLDSIPLSVKEIKICDIYDKIIDTEIMAKIIMIESKI